MRLKNKKTGEIVEPFDITCINGRIFIQFDDGKGTEAYSLAKLNEEWEDYEEPDEIWYIDWKGDIRSADIDNDWECEKEIGNYFETKEKAEKAVEKLKAWNRLKDKCFRFYRWNKGSLLKSLPNTIEFACDDTEMWTWEDIQDDLDLLFGGEE